MAPLHPASKVHGANQIAPEKIEQPDEGMCNQHHCNVCYLRQSKCRTIFSQPLDQIVEIQHGKLAIPSCCVNMQSVECVVAHLQYQCLLEQA